jgi:benzodiazapine receptor
VKFKEWVNIIIWIIVFETIGFLLGMVTQTNLHPWYEGLHKSALTPPGYVFSIIWSILYALLAIVGRALWQNRNNIKIKQLSYLYFIQLVMNWVWTPLFFQWHWLGFSFLWIIGMICLNGVIIASIKNENKKIALALIPYCIWLIFAAYLNGVIWVLN